MKAVRLEDVQYFVDSFEENCDFEILEGKEKEDLTKIAEARGIKIKGSRDLGVFKTVYGFTDRPNKNGAILPKEELLKVLPQIVGKPISFNHDRRLVLGSYINYSYVQKENKIIAYGVFYKSNFPELWKKAQDLFQTKKLSSSFEIWSPAKARKYNADGSYELHQMEIAGGALIYQDKDNTPAFEGADVLAMAKAQSEEAELVYAKKHNETEIIYSNIWKESVEKNLKLLNEKRQEELNKQAPAPEEVPVEPVATSKTKCANCALELDYDKVTETCMGAIKCPGCKAVIDQQGAVLYPPQVIDFKMNCPACSSKDWVILTQEEKSTDLKCTKCSKEYTVAFKKAEEDPLLKKMKFIYSGYVSCIQCGNSILVSSVSDLKDHEVNCKKCGLKFNVNTEKIDKTRHIESINETSSEERRKKQEMTKELEKKEEEKVEAPVVEEPKKEEIVAETPKEEEKPVVEEVKVEPVVEEVKEEPKAEVKEEPVAEEKKEEKPAESSVQTETVSEETPVTSEESKESLPEPAPQENATTEVIEEPVEATTEVKVEDQVICSECENLKAVCKKQKTTIRKAVSKIRQLKKSTKLEQASVEAKELEIAKIKEEAETKIQFYIEQAKTVVERRLELGEYAKDLSDKDIIKDEVFEKAKLEKENADLRAKNESTTGTIAVASSLKDVDYYSSKRREIEAKAFGSIKRTE